MNNDTLKNSEQLRARIQAFNQERNMERLSAVLSAFCESEVLLPVTNGKTGVEIAEIQGKQYLLAFTGKDALYAGLNTEYRGVVFDPLMATELAMANRTDGILLDGFTGAFVIPSNVFGFVRQQLQTRGSREDDMREVGILSTDMQVKIGVPYDVETGLVHQHFGHCPDFKIYIVEDGDVIDSYVIDPQSQGHGAIAAFLAKEEVNFVICGGIGGGAVNALKEAGIKLFAGVNQDADDAVDELLACLLEYDPNPGCGHHHHHDGGGCCGHHHDHGAEGCGCSEHDHGEEACGCGNHNHEDDCGCGQH